MEVSKKYKVTKLICGVSRSGRAYHYFRKVNNLQKKGLFVVEQRDTIDNQVYITDTLFFYNTKEIEDLQIIIDLIEELKLEKLRDKKLSLILE
jgi:hypothetical protein